MILFLIILLIILPILVGLYASAGGEDDKKD